MPIRPPCSYLLASFRLLQSCRAPIHLCSRPRALGPLPPLTAPWAFRPLSEGQLASLLATRFVEGPPPAPTGQSPAYAGEGTTRLRLYATGPLTGWLDAPYLDATWTHSAY